MTCIVGLAHRGRVWIGGDSAGLAGLSLEVRSDAKVFSKGPAVIGFSGSFRGGQLLRSSAFTMPDIGTREVYDYMVTDFADAVRELFKTRGCAQKTNEEESAKTCFLVGLRGRLFGVWHDYQIGEVACGYDAVGCGTDIARGSLHSSSTFASLLNPARRVRAALLAASEHSGGVRPPFTIIEAPPQPPRNIRTRR